MSGKERPMVFRFWRMARKHGNRIAWWPIRLGRSPMGWRNISHHGWVLGAERTPDGSTAFGMMPGLREVLGHAITVGPVQLRFGPCSRPDLFFTCPEGS